MAGGDESSSDVLERVFFWTMIGGVFFVGAGLIIAIILTS